MGLIVKIKQYCRRVMTEIYDIGYVPVESRLTHAECEARIKRTSDSISWTGSVIALRCLLLSGQYHGQRLVLGVNLQTVVHPRL